MSSLHSLKVFLEYIIICNIFSKSVVYLFILLTVSLAEQNLLILMKSSSSGFYFSFLDHAFGVMPHPRSQKFSPVFSSRSFIFSSFTFKYDPF